ncbi:DUF4913 domain-containing protein [Nocardiopsis dassonvillei]|uniref:DUF4913 domain-containing protein n=1 Tax=Nocardiopsis dassonvillei TaxID=2014 RepID=UPI0033FA7ED4
MSDPSPQSPGQPEPSGRSDSSVRLDRIERQVHQLADEVLSLVSVSSPEAPTGTDRPGQPAAAWVDMDGRQAAVALERLQEWITRVLVHHPRTMTRLRPCWYRHPAVVQMLLDLHRAWEHAYRDRSEDPYLALEWWQRHLPRLDQDMSAELGHCTSVRHDPDRVLPPHADPGDVLAYTAWWGGGRDPGDEPPAP